MSDQPDHQAEYKQACDTVGRLRVDLAVGIGHIDEVCERLNTQQRQASLILQHAATSLTVVNPTAAEATSAPGGFASWPASGPAAASRV